MNLRSIFNRSFLLLFLFVLSQSAHTELLLHGATIFPAPEADPVQAGNIIIKDGKIISLETSTHTSAKNEIDLSGKFVAAGFWNNHVHYLFEEHELKSDNQHLLAEKLTDMFLSRGFVSTVDTGSFPGIIVRIKAKIESGELIGPKIYRMGGSFVPEGGSPFYIAPVKLPELVTVAQAKQITSEVLKEEVEGIKIFSASWNTPQSTVLMEPDYARAVVEVASAQGKLTFAHPSDSDGARVAIDAGVDVLAHTFPAEIKGPWDRSLPAKMKQKNVALVPTLKLFRFDLTRIGFPPNLIDRLEQNAVDQLAAIHQAGNPVLFGTDVGYMSDFDTRQEYLLMERAGLDYSDILNSLTTAPATLFKVDDHQGMVKAGFQADLVVLNSDPRENVEAFSDIYMVIKDGEIVFTREN